jgi:hypothetical protein
VSFPYEPALLHVPYPYWVDTFTGYSAGTG